MDTGKEDGYVVFVRAEGGPGQAPESAELPLQTCASYEEARNLQRVIHGSHHECVIRYLGPAGGGD